MSDTGDPRPSRGHLGKTLYVIFSTPVKPRTEVLAQMDKHIERQYELERTGVMFGAGPLFDPGSDAPAAGMIIVRADSFEEADAIAKADPMHASGVRTYRIQRWLLSEGSFTATLTYSNQRMSIA
jgi:uncharacterized protein